MNIYVAMPFVFGLVLFLVFLTGALIILGEAPKSTKKIAVRVMISGTVGLIFAGLLTVVINWFVMAVPAFNNKTCLEVINTTYGMISYTEYWNMFVGSFIAILDVGVAIVVTLIIGTVLYYSISLYERDVHEK